VAQEAFNNILKHARATSVSIELNQQDEAIMLHISDNGNGFDPDHLPSGHFGLGIMAERAELSGASLVVHSQKNRGTDVILTYQL
jgi:signal transduction histidine kinase